MITRPGAESRRAEILEVEKVVEGLRLSINRIVRPGTLDGGDALKVGDTIYVGRGGRTNAEGVAPVALPPLHARAQESGAHVVDLGGRRVLMAADCPESARLVASLGYDAVNVDISEYQKLEGCVTCLSVRIRTTNGRPQQCLLD